MKKVVAIFLVNVVLLQCSMKLLIFACFEANKDYIVSTLCENRNKPQMHCNGKCYLSKKIKKQDDQEKKIPASLKGIEKSMISFYDFENNKILMPMLVHDIEEIPYHNARFSSEHLKNIFQPPRPFPLYSV